MTFEDPHVDESAAPSVSVIIGTYNHEKFLAQAIQSVLDQATNFPFEIIITEDKSTDNTLRIATDYRDRSPDIITIISSEYNQNNPDVFSRAINRAKGTYIAYLDGDDYWTSTEKLQRQFEFMEAHLDCAIVHHAVERVSEDGAPIRRIEGFETRADIEDLIQGNPIASCSVMIRRSTVTPIPDWFSRVKAGDWAIYLIAAQHGWIGRIDGVLGHYRIHDSASWAATPVALQWTMSLAILDEVEKHLDPRHRAAFVRSRTHMVQNIQIAISEQWSEKSHDIAIYEREMRAKEMIAQAEHDIAMVAGTKGRLYEALALAQEDAADAREEVNRVWQKFAERETALSIERQSLLGTLEGATQLLRKQQRTVHRVAVAGAAMSAVLLLALIILLWPR